MARNGALGPSKPAVAPLARKRRVVSRRLVGSLLVMGPLLAILTFLVVYPVGILFLGSFKIERYGRAAVWTLAQYARLIEDPETLSALGNTLVISAGTSLMATVLGLTLAWIVARTDVPCASTLDTLNLVPFFLSNVVGAVAWRVLAAPKIGLLNSLATNVFGIHGPIFDVYSTLGIILVLGLFYTPWVYLFVIGPLKNMDPSLEEASRASGAGVLGTTFRITLPLVLPSTMSAAILVFVTAAGVFAVPLLLGTPAGISTLTTKIYTAIRDYPANYNFAAAISAILFAITVAFVLLQRRVLARREFITITGKGYRPARMRLGPWRWGAFGLNVLFLMMAVVMPLFSLLLVSFQNAWQGYFQTERLTLENYTYLFFVDVTAGTGLKNSLILSTVGATLAVAFCTLISAVVRRTRLPGREVLEFLAILPVTIPGMVLGVGFLMAWVGTPLYGTLLIIMLAYIGHYLPVGQRNVSAALLSVSRELDESSRMSGATWLQTLRRVTAPLLTPTLLATWLLLFITFIREVSASIILFVHGTETLSVALIRIMDYKPYGVAAAYGILQTILLLVCVFLFRRLTGGETRWA